MIKKIISGGQVGADQGALDVAIKYGIPHGGWIQKGRKTQNGILSILMDRSSLHVVHSQAVRITALKWPKSMVEHACISI
jgi:hypothetical protein